MTRPIPPETEVTVGAKDAEVIGQDDVAIQSALRLAAARGVRRVRVRKGTYLLKAPVLLPAGMALVGEGDDTVLRKALFAESPIAHDVNWYERRARVAHPERFPVGARVTLRGKHCTQDRDISAEAIVVAKEGDTLVFDGDYIDENFWLGRGEPVVTTEHPLIESEDRDDLTVADLTLDGAFEGEPGPTQSVGIALQNCHRVELRGLHIHHCRGESVSWQISNDVTVEGCRFHHCWLGAHPGSGSLRMVVRDCVIMDNAHGFFFCWGVQEGLLEGCEIARNGHYGVSVGFHDSRNIIRGNRIFDNEEVGVRFRAGHFPRQSPVGCIVDSNEVENNGSAEAPVAVEVLAHSDEIVLRDNLLRDTRNAPNGVGVRIASTVGRVDMTGNKIEGFATEVVDEREADAQGD